MQPTETDSEVNGWELKQQDGASLRFCVRNVKA
jgi:hypothetical protein